MIIAIVKIFLVVQIAEVIDCDVAEKWLEEEAGCSLKSNIQDRQLCADNGEDLFLVFEDVESMNAFGKAHLENGVRNCTRLFRNATESMK